MDILRPYLYVLAMDWMQWTLIPPAAGSVWPAVPQELSETLTLTTALGYSLLACETCMLNCRFDPVSISSRHQGFISLVPVKTIFSLRSLVVD